MANWVFAPNFSCAQTAPGIHPAQYRLVSKGEPMPFTGVAVGLETYRMESAKFTTQEQLIVGLKEELSQTQQLLNLEQRETAIAAQKMDAKDELYVAATTAKTEVQQALVITQLAYEKAKPHWYEKPLFLIGMGFIGGLYIGNQVLN